MNSIPYSLLAGSIFLVAGASAPAQVQVVMETSTILQTVNSPATFNFSLNAASNSVLVFAFTGEHNSTGSDIAVNYDPSGSNTPMTTLTGISSNNAYTQILALDLGTVSAGLASFDVSSLDDDHELHMFQLSGATLSGYQADSVFQDDADTGTPLYLSNDFTGELPAGSFQLSLGMAQSGNGTGSMDDPSTSTPDYTFSDFGDRGKWTSGIAYTTNTTGVIHEFWAGDTTDHKVLSTVAIAPIPEPSTYALIFGGLALSIGLFRRQRS